jgi:hypothetical protein
VSDPEDADALFRKLFPIQAAGGAVTLEYGGRSQDLWPSSVILKLVGAEVREEKIEFDEYTFGSLERATAYLTALSRVLGRVGDPAAFATCKPSELFQTFAAKADAATVEDFEAALVGADYLGWLVAGEDPPSAAIARFDEVCREIFPMKSENDLASLEFVELTHKGSSLRIVLRLVVWDHDAATSVSSIRDIKEQEVYFGSIHDHEPARMRALLEGMQRVLARALMAPEIETLMPHDLFRGDVMKLKTAVTADDFAKALSARSRLGKLLAATEAVAPSNTQPLTTPEDLAAMCAETFPMRTTDGAATLDFVEATTDGMSLRIVLRLSSSLDASVKEETCGLMVVGAYDRGRVHALLAGMRTTFADVVASKLARAQPSDLLVSELLAKPNTRTETEFAKALRTKARLGRYL